LVVFYCCGTADVAGAGVDACALCGVRGDDSLGGASLAAGAGATVLANADAKIRPARQPAAAMLRFKTPS
jgi:hypothetical protein